MRGSQPEIPFDPLERAREVEDLVMKDGMRKYYRFRASRHYGGIVTADAVGCCFLCAYCWNYRRNLCPAESGTSYAPGQVVENLRVIGGKKGISLFRVSGAEPVLGERSFHNLLGVLQAGRFILETNGLLLGHRPDLIDLLVQHDVSVRDRGISGRIETEYLERYPFVVKNLAMRGWDGKDSGKGE